MKKENGVTVIALVVTIIILLILGGVCIYYLFPSNGLFEKAQQAKQQTQAYSVKEDVMFKIVKKKMIGNWKYTDENIENLINEYGDDGKVNKEDGKIVSVEVKGEIIPIEDLIPQKPDVVPTQPVNKGEKTATINFTGNGLVIVDGIATLSAKDLGGVGASSDNISNTITVNYIVSVIKNNANDSAGAQLSFNSAKQESVTVYSTDGILTKTGSFTTKAEGHIALNCWGNSNNYGVIQLWIDEADITGTNY